MQSGLPCTVDCDRWLDVGKGLTLILALHGILCDQVARCRLGFDLGNYIILCDRSQVADQCIVWVSALVVIY